MPLAAGSRLGPYEILAPLGAGGMGEVYRARDTRLGREVAIKVLPQHLSSNPEIRTRFEREAKTVSSLNHPHICTLFDVGREGETDYLVMELVEGETLAQRLTRGPLPAAEVLKLGEQIADALDRAHRAGVIHRDLKPGNVMLTRSGGKLMDFGLARATGMVGPGGASGSTVMALTQSPTIAQALTAEGTLIGTFQYMSPEQLEGKEADARSDLWSFGAMLYEMVSGRRAFDGRSQASLIAAILERQPEPLSVVAPKTSAMLEAVVVRCLAKDPDDRWQNARDLMHELRVISGASLSGAFPASGVAPASSASPRRPGPVWAAGAALLSLVAGLLLGPRLAPRDPGAPLILSVDLPPGIGLSVNGADVAFSRDGQWLAFVGIDTLGVSKIWIRPLGRGTPQALVGTQGAFQPFWSPDGRSIGFFSGDKLRKISVAGGTPEDLCPAASARGGSWGRDGVIVFAPGAEGPLYRVSAQGGTPVAATALDTSKHEIGHRFPRFLPDGRRFVYATTPIVDKQHEIYLGSIGSMARRFVIRCDGSPEPTADGWLVFRRNGMLHAQRFDPRSGRVSGSPAPLVGADAGVGFQAAPSAWSGSNGVLLFLPRIPPDEQLVWVDRAGNVDPIAGVPVGGWFLPRLSPDGERIVCPRAAIDANTSVGNDLWMVDAGRGIATRYTFDGVNALAPVWSPDGSRLIYASSREGVYTLFMRPSAGGSEPEFVARSAGLVMQCTDWSRDGRFVLYQVDNARTSGDIWLLPMEGERRATPLLHSSFNEQSGRFSPDGRWVAYSSDESGRSEIYVASFPSMGAKVQVSAAGGSFPEWKADGRELYFRGLDNSVLVARANFQPTFHVDHPIRLFRLRGTDAGYSASPDGRRFVVALTGQDLTSWVPKAAVNWTALMKGR